MLSIQEVNYHTNLVKQGKALPIECPFDIKRDGHVVISKTDEDFEVFFKCLDCQNNFKLGINQENLIKESIDKSLNQV